MLEWKLDRASLPRFNLYLCRPKQLGRPKWSDTVMRDLLLDVCAGAFLPKQDTETKTISKRQLAT